MVSEALSVGVWLSTGFEETYCLHLQESGKRFFLERRIPHPKRLSVTFQKAVFLDYTAVQTSKVATEVLLIEKV